MKNKHYTRRMVYILIIASLALGITIKPVEAEVEATDQAIYNKENYSITDYWDADETKRTAPVKEGYVFGGWYADKGTTPLTEETAAKATTAYAKFVPAYVLSVKAQIAKDAEDGEADTTYIRIVTSVDSTNYQNVSFDIWGNNKNQVENVPVITTVYDSINNGEIKAREAFGTAASKLAVLKLIRIASADYHKIIYVRPNWTTMDGTKVEGLAKYIRVEDGLLTNQYISVPINLMERKEVSAGIIELSYANYKDVLEVAKDDNGAYLIDAGRLLPEMNYSVDEGKCIIRFVGNSSQVYKYDTTESLYANVRFKMKTGASISDDFMRFTMAEGEFCNWDEDIVPGVVAWDYQY